MFFNPLESGMKPEPFKHTVYNALVVPRPIGWISTLSSDGVVNLAPFSFFNSLNANPPCVMYCPNSFKPGTREHKDSLTNVEETGEFVFNMCTYALREEMIISAAHSPASVDEMAEAGLEAAECVNVKPPRVKASPIAMELVKRASELFSSAELIHLYGATETAPLVTGLRNEQLLTDSPRGKSAGQPVLGVSVKIDNQTGAAGDPGEVLAKGPNIMAGYWNKPEQTDEVLQDGWYRTGDVGYLDDEGFLYLVDRAKDMIISGGENVYCSEVEDVIYRNPKVLEATVFGVPHPQWGEQVHAVVVRRDETLTEEELIDFCRDSLGGYKLPRSVAFQTEELPKSGPGKVLKRELRAPYWEGHDRGIN